MTQIRERQSINAEEVDDELLDRMFDIKRQEKDPGKWVPIYDRAMEAS